ncbi:MAG: hypothetical protein L6Q57_04395, partial [Alphaproteobacteria bacterium]|nr:hypothetical protein [Alphaproteobacteria bacterium]
MRLFLRCCAVFLLCLGCAAPEARAQILTGYGDPTPMTEALPEEHLDPVPALPPAAQPSYQPVLTGYNSVEQGAPVDFEADRLDYNQDSKTITATGNVVLRQSGRILKADTITYAQPTDTVTAKGHVTLQETNGDIHTADSLVLHDQMKNGVVDRLYSILRDGARFTAQKGERIKGQKVVMQDADYSPCPLC